MKVIVTAQDNNKDSMVDQRFGRCRYFLVMDTEDENLLNAVENQGAIQGHAAGVRAAQQAGELGAKAVITGDVGPNASNILKQMGIDVYKASGKATDAIEKFKRNELSIITEAAEPHAGMSSMAQEKDVKDESARGERIFFPLLEDNGINSRISQHFGHAPFFGLYDTDTKEFLVKENVLDHADPSKSPVDQIVEAVNPTTVFALGIGTRAITLFNEKGICLKTGPYETVKDAVANLDKLEEQSSSCGH